MANCYAGAIGEDKTRTKTVHRLGSRAATGIAKTWQTYAAVTVNADGSGSFILTRDGEELAFTEWGPET
jgi:hypothetical protein